MTKNATTIACEGNGWDPRWPMFFGTSIVNGGLGIMKDKYLAKVREEREETSDETCQAEHR